MQRGKKDGGGSCRLGDLKDVETDKSRVFRDAHLVETREKQDSDDHRGADCSYCRWEDWAHEGLVGPL